MDNFHVGKTFLSFDAVKEELEKLQKSTSAQFYVRDSRSIASAQKRTPDKLMKPELKYTYIVYSCSAGGRKFKSKSDGTRPNQSTFKQDCQAEIRLSASKDGSFLRVASFNGNHNHDCSKEKTKTKVKINEQGNNKVPSNDYDTNIVESGGLVDDWREEHQDVTILSENDQLKDRRSRKQPLAKIRKRTLEQSRDCKVVMHDQAVPSLSANKYTITDADEIFGRHVAASLRNISDHRCKEFLKVKIQEVIFQAQFGVFPIPLPQSDVDSTSMTQLPPHPDHHYVFSEQSEPLDSTFSSQQSPTNSNNGETNRH